MKKQIARLMLEFGFTRTTVVLYSSLLTDGPLAMDKLASLTNQGPKQIKESVGQLMRLRLIGRERQKNQLAYYAADPDIAWLALSADLVWSTDTTMGHIRNLPDTGNPNIEHLRMLCREISTLAQQLYRPQNGVRHHRERDAETPEELAQLTCEIISLANRQILAVSKSPRLPQVSSFWAVLTTRLQEGVKYHRIADIDEVIEHGLKIVSRDIEEYGVDLWIAEQRQITNTFYIVDNRFLSVSHQPKEASASSRIGLGRITNQPQIIARYKKRFDHLSKAAIPGAVVVKHLRQGADMLLQRAVAQITPEEVLWLESLIDFGKFSKFHIGHNWSENQFSRTIARAESAGLVRRNTGGFLVPAYPTDESSLNTILSLTQEPA